MPVLMNKRGVSSSFIYSSFSLHTFVLHEKYGNVIEICGIKIATDNKLIHDFSMKFLIPKA